MVIMTLVVRFSALSTLRPLSASRNTSSTSATRKGLDGQVPGRTTSARKSYLRGMFHVPRVRGGSRKRLGWRLRWAAAAKHGLRFDSCRARRRMWAGTSSGVVSAGEGRGGLRRCGSNGDRVARREKKQRLLPSLLLWSGGGLKPWLKPRQRGPPRRREAPPSMPN